MCRRCPWHLSESSGFSASASYYNAKSDGFQIHHLTLMKIKRKRNPCVVQVSKHLLHQYGHPSRQQYIQRFQTLRVSWCDAFAMAPYVR